ncbi:IQ and ubiquitin-like domain-containing protein [Nylanderia fulva]|uniref:IQ and ubiquitin-like domain-containing protein n=1 Tax=Nylanderia fulva TaxID=613905 RepID=UPI0010FB78D7|nr:IQ and ubiquitin-like domain-containing protein [Nylanderia fulva]
MEVVARIQDSMAKPFLGGWRNTVTGLIYHNACTQTHGTTRNRITQTVTVVDAVTDVVHDQAVQVHFLPDARDKIITPGISSFLTPKTVEEAGPLSRQDDSNILDSIIKIQKYYRAYRARASARANALEATNISRHDKANVTEHARHSQALSAYSSTDFVMLNRRSPRTSSDFESLYNLLDRWRILEVQRTSSTLVGSSRIAACGLILSKEIELLRAIDSKKTAVRLKCRERKQCRLLDELSRPVAWQDNRGQSILVDTLRVQRARQHRNVYTSLANENLSVLERIDLLRDLKRVIDMHTCDQSQELIYLIDQELDLLECRVDTSRLNWLRNRLKLSFLKLARNALQDDLEEDMNRFGWSDTSITRLCRTCDRLLSLEKFPREQRLRSSSCVYCTSMRTRRGPRVVYEIYERMLRKLRRFEAKMGCYSSLAFVVGAKIVCRLVNEIWHGRSGISECDDLDQLMLTRFRRELEWAPWNSLLLTKNEAAIHHSITDIEAFYDSTLLQKFCTKNLQAKVYFESISQARRNIVTPSSMED